MKLVVVTFVSIALVVKCQAMKWDDLVNKYYPKSCPRRGAGEMLHPNRWRQSIVNDLVSASTIYQSDVDVCLRQGERLANVLFKTKLGRSQNFSSHAERLFFDAPLSPEDDRALRHSKSTLLAAKILQNKLTASVSLTPNTFLAFLNSRQFKARGANVQPEFKNEYRNTRTLDGTWNNLQRPYWGASNTAFTRIADCDYEDGIYNMPVSRNGQPLPSTRDISSKLFRDEEMNSAQFTNLAVLWGQFVAHDLSLRVMEQAEHGGIQCCKSDGSARLPDCELHPACAPIDISPHDYFYGPRGVRCLNYVRSATAVPSDGALGPAQQMNTVSSFLDASPVYGSHIKLTETLRRFTCGKLKTTADGFLPSETIEAVPNCPYFIAGDGRINQTPMLAALQTILVREHNRIAQSLHELNSHWDDERLFQEARKIVIAQVQHITYHEWLPLLLGKEYVKKNSITPVGLFSYDYDPNVNPNIINSFATAAFRFFHTLIPGTFLICSNECNQGSVVRLSDYFFEPNIIRYYANGIDAVMRGSLKQPCLDADGCFTSEVTNYLFKSGNSSGIDLVAIDIQRGRDHGLARYNTYRSLIGLRRARTFEDLQNEISPARIATLKSIYKHVDDIDLFVGGMMESRVRGSLLGPTFHYIMGEQFFRTRLGDRFFYDVANMSYSFTPNQMREIKKCSIARLICDNCDSINKIQGNAFGIISRENPLKNGWDLPQINLMHWKE